ncbi:MAG: type IV-A pilus assembly ATPase PilB [Thiotrichaceae bacterium]|nr:type IV-A pilus assembly ATPase PilB [Thiotrichaceae bacterium]
MATTTPPKIILPGLIRKLIAAGLLKEDIAMETLEKAKSTSTPFIVYAVRQKIVNSAEIAKIAADEFGIPLFDIDHVELEQSLVKMLSEPLLKKHRALPIWKRGNRLFLAISDPSNVTVVDEVRFHTKMNVEMVLVEEEKLAKLLERAAEFFDDSMKNLGEGIDDIELGDTEEEKKEDEGAKNDIEDAPIVKFVNKMLLDAIKLGASDLHFEPYEKFYRVRFRVDGVLRSVSNPPIGLSRKMAARIKVMSRLDVSERRVPQDGRIKLKISHDKSIDFRVSTCPTLFGEKIVMRILDSSAAKLNIDVLGYEPEQKQIYLDALAKPYGMILVTGPTGSGKTVSLYTGVNILNTEDINISTAEDPVEINLPGVNQVQVDEKTGMTFAKALKAFLRQDPDVILVGEIRDMETGGIAIKAAQTGHMVLSTLHTNDAPQTLTRMIDMGLQPFAIATAVNLVMAQRLCRRLCTCKLPDDTPRDLLIQEGFKAEEVDDPNFKIFKGNPDGCERCATLGYKGRVGIYQVMPLSDEMRRMIMQGGNAIDLADQARKEGINDLRMSGLLKVKNGFTSLDELNTVVNKD